MRVSLWQQWSSNHSSSFHVIGEFASPEAAQAAAATIRDILDRLAAEAGEANDYDISPLERQIRMQYDLPLGEDDPSLYALDAFWKHAVTYDAAGVVAAGPLVLVSTGETYLEPDGHEALVARLGGRQVHSDREELYQLIITLECQMPDAAVAEQVFNELQSHPQSTLAAYYLRLPEQRLIALRYGRSVEPQSWLSPPWQADAAVTTLTQGWFGADGCFGLHGAVLRMRLAFDQIQLGLPALLRYLARHGGTITSYGIVKESFSSQGHRVAQFATPDAARHAERSLIALMDAIASGPRMGTGQLSTAEQAFYTRQAAPRPKASVWFEIHPRAKMERMVSVVESLLIVTYEPFEQPKPSLGYALSALGGQVLTQYWNTSDPNTTIEFSITAVLPDAAAAASVEHVLALYLAVATFDEELRSPGADDLLREHIAIHGTAPIPIPWHDDPAAAAFGRVARESTQLTLTLVFPAMERGLLRLVEWLRSKGAADITLHASERGPIQR